MKISLWIEDGQEQIVLTGETDTERQLLAKFKDKAVMNIYEGAFYNCRGGWSRMNEFYAGHEAEPKSLIMVLDHAKTTE